MIILPLRCKSCGVCLEITSDQTMPSCPSCGGQMGPAVRPATFVASLPGDDSLPILSDKMPGRGVDLDEFLDDMRTVE